MIFIACLDVLLPVHNGVSGIAEETDVATVVISPWVYHCGHACNWCMWVSVGSGIRSPAAKSRRFVQSEQGSYECCWIWCRLIRVWMAKWWRVWCH